jgi:hypothetical protein
MGYQEGHLGNRHSLRHVVHQRLIQRVHEFVHARPGEQRREGALARQHACAQQSVHVEDAALAREGHGRKVDGHEHAQ